MLILSTSCSDDVMDSVGNTGRSIAFEVNAVDLRSRNAGSEGSLPTVTLHSDAGPLYLIPEVSSTAGDVSRAAAVTTSDIESFGVYASVNSQSSEAFYMDNVEVTRDNSWAPVKEYLWPGSGTLHINAYAPYTDTQTVGEGIAALPVYGTPVLDYVVPADVTRQQDL
ncbi:MAG: fimbrillin family protein, partial [Duncaniella sp.]|nr:fimbrillin family protein [Duncaniella sp.]